MRIDDDSEIPGRGYTTEDPELAGLIDQILSRLQPYPHLDLLREVFVTGVKLAQENCSRGDLKILRAAIKEIRYAFRVFSRYRDVPKVTVFGSARTPPQAPEFQAAAEFSRKMAQAGYMIITGAGNGIMAAGNFGAGRKRSFGLNILLPFEQTANEYIHDDEKLINFRYFFSRKLFFIKESSAIVLLPGGFGTLDECFEALTLIQTGKSHPVPVVLLDRPGGTYWTRWMEFVRSELLARGMISPEDLSLVLITHEPEGAVQEILQFYRVYHSSRFVNRRRQLVIRLKTELPEEALQELNREFADILVEGRIEPCRPFPEEEDESDTWQLPRLVLAFDQLQYGRLRQLIDAINRAVPQAPGG